MACKDPIKFRESERLRGKLARAKWREANPCLTREQIIEIHTQKWAQIYVSVDYRDKLIARLLAKRLITPSGCWEWTGTRSNSGRGQISAFGKLQLTSRISWNMFRGPIPDGIFVCHKCDNPPCFNPDCLFLGTPQENTSDMVAKGRLNPAIGERSGKAKLRNEQVLEIKRMLAAGMMRKTIAGMFGITDTVVSGIALGRYWSHIVPNASLLIQTPD